MYLVPQFAHTPSPDGTATALAAAPLAAVSGGAKAAGIAERAAGLIAGKLSGDSRAFIKSNLQTGGE